MSSTRRVSAVRIDCISRFCCSSSLETFSGRSDESTTPLTKRRYSGRNCSASSMMKTRCTYSLRPRGASRFHRSNGAVAGMYRRLVYSRLPSTLLWLQRSGSAKVVRQVFVELLVLVVADVAACSRPERRGGVDDPGLLVAARQRDRERDVVRVLVNQVFEPQRFGKFRLRSLSGSA